LHCVAAAPAKLDDLARDRRAHPVAAAHEARAPRPRSVEVAELEDLERRALDRVRLGDLADELARQVGRDDEGTHLVGREHERAHRAVARPRAGHRRRVGRTMTRATMVIEVIRVRSHGGSLVHWVCRIIFRLRASCFAVRTCTVVSGSGAYHRRMAPNSRAFLKLFPFYARRTDLYGSPATFG
jgi:hypothetical protein